ncbi:MAG: 2-polyprenylphenol 6-hydroxylase [Hyphomicrobiaceae bacterium]
MLNAIASLFRLARAGVVLAQYGVRFVPKGTPAPLVLRVARAATFPIRLLSWPFRSRVPRERRIASALTALGPSYIKLGQFLATRGDLIDPEIAQDLRHLQDRLPAFSMDEARRSVEDALGGKLEDHFTSFSNPIAAASIAQVHKATVLDNGAEHAVAVKILRPGIERRFQRDLASYYFAARAVEAIHKPSRRLRPMAVVETLERTTTLEMDLRLEAAAISEMADNIGKVSSLADGNFRVPTVDWRRTTKRVLTMEWIDGTPISEIEQLKASGHDCKALGLTVLRAFLRHAMRDGFFHADMHQGNLLVEPDGTVAAVDFGIMGRLGKIERRFLAEILHGLITRDYMLAAQIHFDAGYVPAHQSVAVFAQAMRAIGEPIHGRTADEISMADLLGQLFAYTDVFDMETRPELILLQKSMVIVEGVARSLDPALNIWTAAEPIAREWMEENYGIAGRLREAGDGAETLGRILADVPGVLHQIERSAHAFATMANDGVRLDDGTLQRMSEARARQNQSARWALWLAAIGSMVIAGLLLAERV